MSNSPRQSVARHQVLVSEPVSRREMRKRRLRDRGYNLRSADPKSADPALLVRVLSEDESAVSSSRRKAPKPIPDEKEHGSPFPLRGSPASTTASSVSASGSGMTQEDPVMSDPKIVSLEPRVILVKLAMGALSKNIPPVRQASGTTGGPPGLANRPASSTVGLLKHDPVKTKTGAKSPVVTPSGSSQTGKRTTRPKGSPAPRRPPSTPSDRRGTRAGPRDSLAPRQPPSTPSDRRGTRAGRRTAKEEEEEEEEDLLDEELSLGLSLGVDFELTQSSSSSSEDEELPSLQQILEGSAKLVK